MVGTMEYVKQWRDKFAPGVAIVDKLPDGWRVCEGANHCPSGAKWVATGSMFWRTNGLKRYEHALLFVGR